MSMRIRVFHNINYPDSFAFGYKPHHRVVEVYTYDDTTSATADDALQNAFMIFNVGDDPDFGPPNPDAVTYRHWLNRSLSVGDVVAVDGHFYSCASNSWEPIPEEPTTVTETRHGTTPLGSPAPHRYHKIRGHDLYALRTCRDCRGEGEIIEYDSYDGPPIPQPCDCVWTPPESKP